MTTSAHPNQVAGQRVRDFDPLESCLRASSADCLQPVTFRTHSSASIERCTAVRGGTSRLKAELAFADIVVVSRGRDGHCEPPLDEKSKLLRTKHVGKSTVPAHEAFHRSAVAEMSGTAGVADAAV